MNEKNYKLKEELYNLAKEADEKVFSKRIQMVTDDVKETYKKINNSHHKDIDRITHIAEKLISSSEDEKYYLKYFRANIESLLDVGLLSLCIDLTENISYECTNDVECEMIISTRSGFINGTVICMALNHLLLSDTRSEHFEITYSKHTDSAGEDFYKIHFKLENEDFTVNLCNFNLTERKVKDIINIIEIKFDDIRMHLSH